MPLVIRKMLDLTQKKNAKAISVSKYGEAEKLENGVMT